MARLNGLKIAESLDVENPGAAFADLRPFEKHDWYGWAGAQNFPDGSEPLIGEVQVTNWPEEDFEGGRSMPAATIIVDAQGISINGMNGAYADWRSGIGGGSKEELIAKAKQLMATQPIDVNKLKAEGWEDINLPSEPYEQPQVTEEEGKDVYPAGYPNAGRKPMNASVKVAGDFQGAWTNEPEPGPQELGPVNDTIAFLKSDPNEWYAIKFNGYAGDEGTYEIHGLAGEPGYVADLAASFGLEPFDLANQSEDGYFAYATKAQRLAFSELSLTNPTETYGARNDEEYFHSPSELADYEDILQSGEEAEEQEAGAPAYLECPDCGKRVDTWDGHQYNATGKLEEHREKEHKASAKTAVPREGVNRDTVDHVSGKAEEKAMRSEEQIYRELEQEGAADRELHEENEPAPDEETTESIISHASNVLQDTSMKQEDRLMRAYSEIGQFLENKGIKTSSAKTADKTAGPLEGAFNNYGQPETDFPLDQPPHSGPTSIPSGHSLSEEKIREIMKMPFEAVAQLLSGAEIKQLLEYQSQKKGSKTAGTDFAYKTEVTTPDGYEIQSYNPYADPANARRFTVWPPKGNAVGDYTSLEEANTAIEQWKQFGKPELLQRDGGARFKVRKQTTPAPVQSSDKTAGPINVDNPEQAFKDRPDKYLVHVALQALEGLAGKVNYRNAKPAENALAKLLKEGGIQYGEFIQVGYDDMSFEVSDQAAAIKATDYLNNKLPKSTDSQGYGYGTAEPAQAASYKQDSDQQEGDLYSNPGGWGYPESTL
jgi:hypothetical protein